ncbi:MAG: RNA polymerase subunit sigma-24 [Thalassobius sp.]|nr:RNA polymerase subunit sigma-24 [Thalassovita sp.]
MKMKLSQKHTETTKHLSLGNNRTDQPPSAKSLFDYKSDREIWLEFKKGNEAAFNHIYRKYTPGLYNFAYQFTRNKDIIKDSIQNVYISIRRRREKLSEVNSIKAYLYKAIYREMVKKLEKERKFISDEALTDDLFNIELSFEDKIIGDEITEEIKTKLDKILKQLTNKQKEALLLFYAEGLSYKEVAEVMGLKNSKSARKLIYRALDTARKEVNTGNYFLDIPALISLYAIVSQSISQ